MWPDKINQIQWPKHLMRKEKLEHHQQQEAPFSNLAPSFYICKLN
jgi:hypothetical protein